MTQIIDAVKILEHRVPEDAELREMIAEEARKLAIAQLVYDARTEAGLTQRQLAERIGTRQPVIARLEDADYGSQSIAMLHRIAKATGKQVRITLIDIDQNPENEDVQYVRFTPEQVEKNWTPDRNTNHSFQFNSDYNSKPQPGYKPGGAYLKAA